MTAAAMPTDHARAAGWVSEPDGSPRIASLDVMRGIAILGILFMNINTMGGSVWAVFAFDIRHLGWTPLDRGVWMVRELVADGTARCMLELLFGAGMTILTDRLARGAESHWMVLQRYYWRNIVLFLFGVAHMTLLLWGGDILHTYAIAAMLVALVRGLPPRAMLFAGLVMVVIPAVGNGIGWWNVNQLRGQAAAIRARAAEGVVPTRAERTLLAQDDKRLAERAVRAARNAVRIAAEDRARTGDAAEWAGSTWRTEVQIQGKGIEVSTVWEAVSIMLVGAALYGWGVLQGERSRRFYLATAAAGYAVGLSIRVIGIDDALRFDDAASLIWPLYEVSRLATTLGHVAAIHLLLGTVIGARWLLPFAAAGRTALSIYILQTLLCLWVLYPPWGLALYGTQGWAALMATAASVNLALLLLANWWVRHYRIAPVEWAWRSIVEGRRLPFRRTALRAAA